VLFAGAVGGGLRLGDIFTSSTTGTRSGTRTSTRTTTHGCIITGVAYSIVEPPAKLFVDGAFVPVHSGIPHGTHPVENVDAGIDPGDPNIPTVERNYENSLNQGTPQRIFPDYRVPAIGADGKVFLQDQVDRIHYDIVRVTATFTGADSSDMVLFRAFDLDDPSKHVSPEDDPTGNENLERDNRGILTRDSGKTAEQSKEGFWILGTTEAPGDQIVSVPVSIDNAESGSGSAVIYFRVTHNAGDNFKIAATCAPNGRDLLSRTRNIDRVGDYLTSNDGLILFLYKAGGGSGKPGVELRDPQYQPEFPIGAWINKSTDPVKVTSTLTTWRYLYVESDAMATKQAGDTYVGTVTRVVIPPRGGAVFTAFITLNKPVRSNQLQSGFLRLSAAAPAVAAPTSAAAGTGGSGLEVQIDLSVTGPVTSAMLTAVIGTAGAVTVYDDDWEFVQAAGSPAGTGTLNTRVDTRPEADFALMQGKGKEDSAGNGDKEEFNRYAPAYIRPNYSALVPINRTSNALGNAPSETTALFAASRGQIDSLPLRANLFWSLYAAVCFQMQDGPPGTFQPAGQNKTNDPDVGPALQGFTDGPLAGRDIAPRVSFMARETIRDIAVRMTSNVTDWERFVVLHEIAHQLLGGGHSNDSPVLGPNLPPGEGPGQSRPATKQRVDNLKDVKFTDLELRGLRDRTEPPGDQLPNTIGK
jgi:hypothetical protein